jgi:hypothetical protein
VRGHAKKRHRVISAMAWWGVTRKNGTVQRGDGAAVGPAGPGRARLAARPVPKGLPAPSTGRPEGPAGAMARRFVRLGRGPSA